MVHSKIYLTNRRINIMVDYKRYGRKKDNILTDIINLVSDCIVFVMFSMIAILGIASLIGLISIFISSIT